jgi:hypothetical protein
MAYDGKPVSLHPLEFEEAVKELLKAKPGPSSAAAEDPGTKLTHSPARKKKT